MLRFKTANWILPEVRPRRGVRALCMQAVLIFASALKRESVKESSSLARILSSYASPRGLSNFPHGRKIANIPLLLSPFSLLPGSANMKKKRRLSCRDWNLESLFANLKYGRGHRGRPFALTRRGKAVHLKCALACSRSLSSFSKDTFAKERMKIEGKNGRRPTRE